MIVVCTSWGEVCINKKREAIPIGRFLSFEQWNVYIHIYIERSIVQAPESIKGIIRQIIFDR